jgi:hypothetical protein
MPKRLGHWLGLGVLSCALWFASTIPVLGAGESLKYKGMSYACWGSGIYSTSDSDLSLSRLAETGSTWIALIVTGYQDNLRSTKIYRNEATPTNEDLARAVARAHDLGLKVLLKPHLDLWDDATHWRGEIGNGFATEAQWTAWFDSYRAFINEFAELASSLKADMFCAGTELLGTTSRAADWRSVIADIRSRYGGPVIYAANHSGEETDLDWWDAVDIIGVDAYYPLSTRANPSLEEIKSSWAVHRDTLARLSSRWNRPIVFTEIGYRSIAGSVSHPWDWQIEGAVDLKEQATAYRAVMETFDGLPWFVGLFWWSWGTDPFEGGPCDDNYTPHDKPAEAVVRTWYGAPVPWRPEPKLEPDDSRAMNISGEGLAPGWEDWSWEAQVNPCDAVRACHGAYSIGVRLEAWGALSLWHEPFRVFPDCRLLQFCFYAPSNNPPQLWVYFYDRDARMMTPRQVDDCRFIEEGHLRLDAWNHVSIPLQHLMEPGRGVSRICFEDRSGKGSVEFWVDDIRMVGARSIVPVERTKRDGSPIRDGK